MDLLIRNIGVLATPTGSSAIGGSPMDFRMDANAAIGIRGDKIAYVGSDIAIEARRTMDAGGRLATPGLVDAHTHLVFGGSRQHELPAKLAGASYMEILRAGGGILSTVRATRDAEYGELRERATKHLDQMMAHGTTSVEIKSGYGLNLETERKQLSVIDSLWLGHDMDIVATFMGAHAIPPEYTNNTEGYVSYLINEMIPKIALHPYGGVFCDIFCEEGIFDIDQSRRILVCAKNHGFELKIHADEITPIGGASLAAELGCISAEHLIEATDEGLEAMAKAGTIAVLLPATSFYLGKNYARALKMMELGIPIALATDFNPGSSPNFNMQLVLNLAYLKYRLSPEAAITAATLNAAAAIGLAGKKGSIEVGKDADIVFWDCPDLNYLFYHYGSNLVRRVIKNGKVINND